MRAATAIVAAAAAALSAGCGGPPAEAGSLFPLQAGHVWTYRTTLDEDHLPPERETLVLATLGREDLDGGPGLEAGPAWRRRSASGVDYWLRADASGIWRVASKSDLDAEPRPDAQRRYVLKAPYKVGTSWTHPTTAYLLKRRQEFPREIRHSHPAVPMVYTIEAVGETVAVPAGEFSDCLRVRGLAQVRLFADPTTGWRDLPLITTEWYCRGVGLVRLEREEPVQSAFLSGGRYTMELMTWQ